MSAPRVRFAPSPTGPLHIGGVRTALYNYLLARKMGGTFILRIEDTDQTRFVPGAEEYIIETLKWCGMELDEGPGVGGDYGPYRQSERKGMYREYAERLIAEDKAYYAFDTPADLEEMRERMGKQGNAAPKYDSVTRQYMKNSLVLSADEVKTRLDAGEDYVIRMKMPRNEEVRFEDAIRGWVQFNTKELDDKVLLKSDGMPTYHLANVVDDHLMKITHVIRGEEWLPSAPTHVMLYKYLGWEETMPTFAHLPLILRPDGKGKLSKRDGDKNGFPVFPLDWKDAESGAVTATGFRERGFFPGAFLNMLAFLGWNPGTEQEIFSKEELIEAFSLERIGKSGARFDFEKAKWFNQQYFRAMSPEELAHMVKPILASYGIDRDDEFVKTYCSMLVERVTFLNDFWEQGGYFFEPPHELDEKTITKKWKEGKKESFPTLIDMIGDLTEFTATNIEATVKQYMADHSLGFGDVLPMIRIMLTGTMQGPPIFETAVLLGKHETVTRMRNSIEKFDHIAANA